MASPYDIAGLDPITTEREEKILLDTWQEFAQAQIVRNTFAQQWEEIAELVLPTSRNTFYYGGYLCDFHIPFSKAQLSLGIGEAA